MTLKTITIDFDNPSDLKKHITILQRRRKTILKRLCNYTKTTFSTSKYNLDDIAPILNFLLDLKYIPTAIEDNQQTNYYVYLHLDPTNKININRDIRELLLAARYNIQYVPFYVGKGVGTRCYDLARNEGHRKIRSKLLKNNTDIQVIKIIENVSEQEALFEEQKLISLLGLISLHKQGMLVNLQTDKEIITRFITEQQNFKIPKELLIKSVDAKNRCDNRYKSVLSTIKSWI